MRLEQMGSNQTKIVYSNGDEIFFSYNTPVAGCVSFGLFKTKEKFGRTTSKHINSYINGRCKIELPQSQIDSLVNIRENGGNDNA